MAPCSYGSSTTHYASGYDSLRNLAICLLTHSFIMDEQWGDGSCRIRSALCLVAAASSWVCWSNWSRRYASICVQSYAHRPKTDGRVSERIRAYCYLSRFNFAFQICHEWVIGSIGSVSEVQPYTSHTIVSVRQEYRECNSLPLPSTCSI